MKIHSTIAFFVFIVFWLGCHPSSKEADKYDIVRPALFDKTMDDPSFMICDGNNILQFFSFSKEIPFHGEKLALTKYFDTNFTKKTSFSGFIRVKFIVNCQGRLGRFRVISGNSNFEALDAEAQLTEQLLKLTKQMKGWKIMSNEMGPFDYYQYLIFELDNGSIKNILP